MAWNDLLNGMNIWGTSMPEILSGTNTAEGPTAGLLDAAAQEKLKNKALLSGLIGAGATYFALPKNQRLGLGSILGKSYLAGMQSSSGAYDAAMQNELTKMKIAKEQRDAILDYQKAIPSDVREYEYAKNQGYAGTFQDWAKEQANLKAPKTTIDLSNFMGKESFKPFIDKVTSTAQSGYNASKSMPSLNEMESLVKSGVPTGAGAEFAKSVSKVGQIFNPDFNVKNLTAQEAFTALSTQAILPQVKQLGVNPTDTDLRFIVEGSPALSKSQAGNLLLIKALKLSKQRDQEIARFSNQWRVKNAALVKKDPYLADAQYDQDMMSFLQTSPIFTDSANQLKSEYNAIITNQANPDVSNALQRGGLIKQPKS